VLVLEDFFLSISSSISARHTHEYKRDDLYTLNRPVSFLSVLCLIFIGCFPHLFGTNLFSRKARKLNFFFICYRTQTWEGVCDSIFIIDKGQHILAKFTSNKSKSITVLN
jgi:hypothetical protein